MFESDKEPGRRAFLRSMLAGTGATVLGLSGCALDGEKSAGERDLVDTMDRARALFAFEPGVTYLNNGSLGSCPGPVHEAMVRAMRSVDANPTRVFWNDLLPVVDAVRERAARLMGAAPEEVAVVRNTTEGMNVVASGLALRKNDEILTTTREHDGGFLCWKYLSERIGVRIRTFTPPTPPEDPGVLVDLVRKNLTPATRVVSLCHMVSPTGLVFPLKEISEIVRPRGIFLVADGAHPPGQMRVDVRALGVDTYASSSHKWLCAPRGTGLLYVRREVQDEIRPLIAGTRDYRRTDARRYEACGTRSLEALVGLKAALGLCEEIGLDRIYDLVDSPSIGINLDTGNAYLAGADVYEWLDRVVERLVHLHAKDISVEHSDAERGKVTGTPVGCACGEGVLDWDRIVKTVQDRCPQDIVFSVECGTPEQAAKSLETLGKLT